LEKPAAPPSNQSCKTNLLRGSFTLLAPDLVEPVLDGRVADRVALPALLEPIPLVWAHQREHVLSGEPT